MNTLIRSVPLLASMLVLVLAGCNKETPSDEPDTKTTQAKDESASSQAQMAGGEDHGHADEISLGTTTIGDLQVECWQGHGETRPGREMHLVVKLPYTDSGATVVRAWIGTEDRLLSVVGKGEYAPSHDDYDIHAVAPDPLPEGARWWIEIEQPDGTRSVGSIDFN